MEQNFQNNHVNKFLNPDDLLNAQKIYRFFYKILLFGTLIGLINVLIFILGGVRETTFYSSGIYWGLIVIYGFAFGSLVLFLEKKHFKAILFGIGFSLLGLFIYFLNKYIHNNFQLSNNELGRIRNLLHASLFVLFFFIHGLLRNNIKTGLFASIGYIIAFYFNNFINTGLFTLISTVSNFHHLFFPNIFEVVITWYFVLLFESISYNENYRKVFKRLFEVSRRLDRKNYLITYLYAFIPSYLIGISSNQFAKEINIIDVLVFYLPLAFLTIISIIQAIKRMHDINMRGWWIFVPFWNIYLLFFKKGDNFVNKYGQPLYL